MRPPSTRPGQEARPRAGLRCTPRRSPHGRGHRGGARSRGAGLWHGDGGSDPASGSCVPTGRQSHSAAAPCAPASRRLPAAGERQHAAAAGMTARVPDEMRDTWLMSSQACCCSSSASWPYVPAWLPPCGDAHSPARGWGDHCRSRLHDLRHPGARRVHRDEGWVRRCPLLVGATLQCPFVSRSDVRQQERGELPNGR